MVTAYIIMYDTVMYNVEKFPLTHASENIGS